MSDVWKLPESRKYSHVDVYESSRVWYQNKSKNKTSIWSSWWFNLNFTWSLTFESQTQQIPRVKSYRALVCLWGNSSVSRKMTIPWITSAHWKSPVSCHTSYLEAWMFRKLPWNGKDISHGLGRPSVLLADKDSVKIRLWNLGFPWSTFQIISFLSFV